MIFHLTDAIGMTFVFFPPVLFDFPFWFVSPLIDFVVLLSPIIVWSFLYPHPLLMAWPVLWMSFRFLIF